MVFWLCGVIVFILDRWTKYLVVENIALGQTLPVIKDFFHLTYILNPGAAFGLFAEKPWPLIIISVIILLLILYLQYSLGKDNLWLSIAFGLVIGGALGNFLDRIQTGLVVDFIDFRGIWSYIFNLADAAIVIAMFILVWQILVTELK